MKTFDEAVRAAMTAKAGDPDAVEHVKQLQEAFMHDISFNPIVLASARAMAQSIMVAVATLPDARPENAEEVEELNAQMDAVVVTGILSVFMWGLATGREMEKADLPNA